ncbi:LamG-like jellyroll fold domain-containing protein, partial [uncultured Lutibacter sp.]|uniref:LamG-like jellyroll fold domain-containing protein n=1 Tax=uncultured Lutibacter sp. TaxID=437739 RepID=UPI002613F730
NVDDVNGNPATAVTQTVVVTDNEIPTASNPATINASGSAPDPDITVVTDEADNCTANPVIAFVSDTPSGSCPVTITRIYSVTDNAGNSINVTQTIIVNDAINPIARCVADFSVTLTLDGVTGEATLLANQIDDGSTDNCGNISLSLDKYVFGCNDIGVNDVELTVTDSQGNSDTCITKITVDAPTINSGTLEGYIVQTETTADASDVIDITACPVDVSGNTIQQDIALNLTVSPALASNINRWEYSTNGGVTWLPIANNTTSHTIYDIKVTTLVRVVIDVGDCLGFSPIAVLAVVPPDLPPTIVNGTEMNTICLGETVTVVVESEFGVGSEVNNGGLFNEANLNTLGWQVDGEAEMSAGGDNGMDTYWKETNGPKKLNNRCFDVSDNSKFAVVAGIPPIINQPNNVHIISPLSTLETPIFSALGLTTMQLEFDQAYYLETGAWLKIEISTDGGANYDIELDPGAAYDYIGPSDTGFINPYPGFTGQCRNTLGAVLNDNHVSIDLQQYIGLTNLRIKFTYSGTANSVWAIDNIQIPNNPVDEVIEWTDDFGVVVGTGSTINIDAVTPGIQNYGATSLINGCRSDDNSGTEFITIEATLSYAGENIVPIVSECGEDTVILAAYDNTITAQENYDNGVYNNNYKVPNIAPVTPNYPGTGEIGTWTISSAPTSCSTGLPATYTFSDINDPNATFTGEPGTYTLTWTVNGCSNSVNVTINSCSDINFDGVNDYITFKDNYDRTGAFSIEMWVKPEDLVGTQCLFSKRDANDLTTGYDLRLSGSTVQFYWGNNAISSNAIDAITWHHIAVTFNGSVYKLYIDGVEKASQNSNMVPIPNSMECILGAMDQANNPPNKPVNNFHGWIDELRIWNKALDIEHIRQMMNQEIKLTGGDDVVGEIIPIKVSGPDVTQNGTEDDPLLWSNLDGYYRMGENCGYLTPTKGSLNGRLRNITTSQEESAPLPYTTNNDGAWDNNNTWTQTSVWYIPNSTVFGTKIDWNIVQMSNIITSGIRDITLLGLISDSGKLTMDGSTNLTTGTGTGQGLWITHYLNLDGIIDLEGESQLIQKRYYTAGNATIQFNESILDGSSSGYIERDQQGQGNLYNYEDWSSPVGLIGQPQSSSYSVKDVLKDGRNSYGSDINFTPANDGDMSTSPITVSSRWIYTYKNGAGFKRANLDKVFKAGEGHTMKGSFTAAEAAINKQNFVYRGKPHNEDIQLTISNGNYYLIGNPYSSALDADQFIIDNAINNSTITGVLEFYEDWSTDNTHIESTASAGYAYYTLAGGVGSGTLGENVNNPGEYGSKTPTRYVPVGQAFWVVGDGGGTVEFNNNQREFVTEGIPSESIFFKGAKEKISKSSKAEKDLRLKIRIGFETSGIKNRQLLLTIDERASNKIDKGFDAEVSVFQDNDFYWLTDNKKLVIQAIDYLSKESVIPVGVSLKEKGNIKIKVDTINNAFENMEIYLRNNISNDTYDILNNEFEVELESGEFNNMYSIVFKPKFELSETNEELSNNFRTHIIENELRIIRRSEIKISNISLFNIIGQQILSRSTNIDKTEIILPVNVEVGVYLVVIETEKGSYSKKVIKK